MYGLKNNDPILFTFPQYHGMVKEIIGELSNYHEGIFFTQRYQNQELHLRVETPVRNKLCFILGSITPPDEQLLTITLLSHTLKQEGAKSIIAIIPYLAYSRHDKLELGGSLGTAWVGRLLQAAGVSTVLTVDVHSQAIHSLYPMPVISISPAAVFAKEIQTLGLSEVTLVAPDAGAKERCLTVAHITGIHKVAVLQKKRIQENIIHVGIEGTVSKRAIVFDDMLDTGRTLVSAARLLRQQGVKEIYIMVTHGLFTGTAWEELFTLGIKTLYTTDTVNFPYCSFFGRDIRILSITSLLITELKKHMNQYIPEQSRREIPQMYA